MRKKKHCSAEIPFGTHGSAATWFRTWKHPELSRNDHGQHGTTQNHWFPKATNDQLVLCWGPPFQETSANPNHHTFVIVDVRDPWNSMDIWSKSQNPSKLLPSCDVCLCRRGENLNLLANRGRFHLLDFSMRLQTITGAWGPWRCGTWHWSPAIHRWGTVQKMRISVDFSWWFRNIQDFICSIKNTQPNEASPSNGNRIWNLKHLYAWWETHHRCHPCLRFYTVTRGMAGASASQNPKSSKYESCWTRIPSHHPIDTATNCQRIATLVESLGWNRRKLANVAAKKKTKIQARLRFPAATAKVTNATQVTTNKCP